MCTSGVRMLDHSFTASIAAADTGIFMTPMCTMPRDTRLPRSGHKSESVVFAGILTSPSLCHQQLSMLSSGLWIIDIVFFLVYYLRNERARPRLRFIYETFALFSLFVLKAQLVNTAKILTCENYLLILI